MPGGNIINFSLINQSTTLGDRGRLDTFQERFQALQQVALKAGLSADAVKIETVRDTKGMMRKKASLDLALLKPEAIIKLKDAGMDTDKLLDLANADKDGKLTSADLARFFGTFKTEGANKTLGASDADLQNYLSKTASLNPVQTNVAIANSNDFAGKDKVSAGDLANALAKKGILTEEQRKAFVDDNKRGVSDGVTVSAQQISQIAAYFGVDAQSLKTHEFDGEYGLSAALSQAMSQKLGSKFTNGDNYQVAVADLVPARNNNATSKLDLEGRKAWSAILASDMYMKDANFKANADAIGNGVGNVTEKSLLAEVLVAMGKGEKVEKPGEAPRYFVFNKYKSISVDGMTPMTLNQIGAAVAKIDDALAQRSAAADMLLAGGFINDKASKALKEGHDIYKRKMGGLKKLKVPIIISAEAVGKLAERFGLTPMQLGVTQANVGPYSALDIINKAVALKEMANTSQAPATTNAATTAPASVASSVATSQTIQASDFGGAQTLDLEGFYKGLVTNGYVTLEEFDSIDKDVPVSMDKERLKALADYFGVKASGLTKDAEADKGYDLDTIVMNFLTMKMPSYEGASFPIASILLKKS